MEPLEALKTFFGYDSFRPGQQEIIDTLLRGRDVLAVMPTGGGKSVCYQIPALLLPGVTIVISPLISLMKDQVNALVENGVPAAFINTTLTARQISLVLQRMRRGAYKLVYVAPERLEHPAFLTVVRTMQLSMVCVDEAHCVSQWGHDFRPSYQTIAPFLASLPQRPVVFACTATATARVQSDILRLLELQSAACVSTGFDRSNLFFSVLQPSDKLKAVRALLQQYPAQCGILYCATRKNVELLYQFLLRDGASVARYHAGLPQHERKAQQEQFLSGAKQIMVATNAFGMGIDKANVRFIIHFNMPGDLESYYQEAGRAGRDGKSADCILLFDKKDVSIQQYFINHTAPDTEIPMQTLREMRALRQEKLSHMIAYAKGEDCLRGQILRYFGEMPPVQCGYCSVCCKKAIAGSASALEKGETNADLLSRLTALRDTIAKRKSVPAFTVLTNKALLHIANAQPRTVEDFAKTPGVSAAKIKNYAVLFLREIERWADDPENSQKLR